RGAGPWARASLRTRSGSSASRPTPSHLLARPGLAEGLEGLVAALVVVDVADVLGLEAPVVGVHGGVAQVGELGQEQLAGLGLGLAVELGDRALDLQAPGLAPVRRRVG